MPSFAKRLAELAAAPFCYDEERTLALVMGLHPRLGVVSPLRWLDDGLLARHIAPRVADWVYPRAPHIGMVDDDVPELIERERRREDDFVLTTKGGTCLESAVRYRITFAGDPRFVVTEGLVPRPGYARGRGPAADWYHAPVAVGDTDLLEICFSASSRTEATAAVERAPRPAPERPYDPNLEMIDNRTAGATLRVDPSAPRGRMRVGAHLTVELWLDQGLLARQRHERRLARRAAA